MKINELRKTFDIGNLRRLDSINYSSHSCAIRACAILCDISIEECAEKLFDVKDVQNLTEGFTCTQIRNALERKNITINWISYDDEYGERVELQHGLFLLVVKCNKTDEGDHLVLAKDGKVSDRYVEEETTSSVTLDRYYKIYKIGLINYYEQIP